MSQWESRAVDAHEAVRLVTSGMRVFVHGAAATPTPLARGAGAAAATSRTSRSITCTRPVPRHLSSRGSAGRFLSVSLFAGPPVRDAIERGTTPTSSRSFCPTSRRCSPRGPIPLDVALLQLSPPDGTATARSARRSTRPCGRAERRAHRARRSTSGCRGRTATPWSPLDRLTAFVHTSTGRSTRTRRRLPARSRTRSASTSARLVEDGATLQMGIGAIPDAVLARLLDQARSRHSHRDVLGRRRRPRRGRRRSRTG